MSSATEVSSRGSRATSRACRRPAAAAASDTETERYLLFTAVVGLLAEIAETVPLCVVLDDLHWADAQSVALLKHLVRASEQGALQVIATYRDSDLGKDHPLTAVLADLRAVQGVQRIALHGLGADEVARDHERRRWARARSGRARAGRPRSRPRPAATRSSWARSYVACRVRRGSCSTRPAGRWSVDRSSRIALPESVREVIERRVERLGEESLRGTQAGRGDRARVRPRAARGRRRDREAQLLDQLEAAVAASVLAESSERSGAFASPTR